MPAPSSFDSNSRQWLLICVAIALIWFAGLGWRPLLSPDEGRYAEIAREMAVSGDYVTPRLNGLKYFEKPPLHYWLTALAFKAFGVSDWLARAVAALYGIGVVVLVHIVLARLHGRDTARLGALLAAGTCWIAAMGHFVSLDIGLAFWLTMTLGGLLAAIERVERPDLAAARWPDLWVWVGVAGAFLSKGLIGLVIPGAAMFLCIVATRRLSLLRALRWWPGALVAAALVLPWLVAVSIRNPGFLEFFFIHEHFQRFTSDVHRRVEPWWYFIPVFLLGGLPWLGHWPAVWRARRRSAGDALLLLWCLFLFLFFSASGSKLPSYILPMFPALAIWLARQRHALTGATLRRSALPLLAAGVVLAAAAVPLIRESDRDEAGALAGAYLPWAIAACIAMIGGAVLGWRNAGRVDAGRDGAAHAQGLLPAIAPLALGMLLAVQCLQWGHATMGERFSGKGLVQRWRAQEPALAADTPVFSVGSYDQSVPFYLGRTVTLVDYRDEMDLGLKAEPHKYGGTSEALIARWPTLPLAYALLDLRALEQWRAAGVPFREVTRNGRRAVIANR